MTTSRTKYLNEEQASWVDEIVVFCNTHDDLSDLKDLYATRRLAESLMCDKSDAELTRVVTDIIEGAPEGWDPADIVMDESYRALVGRLGEEEACEAIDSERDRRDALRRT